MASSRTSASLDRIKLPLTQTRMSSRNSANSDRTTYRTAMAMAQSAAMPVPIPSGVTLIATLSLLVSAESRTRGALLSHLPPLIEQLIAALVVTVLLNAIATIERHDAFIAPRWILWPSEAERRIPHTDAIRPSP